MATIVDPDAIHRLQRDDRRGPPVIAPARKGITGEIDVEVESANLDSANLVSADSESVISDREIDAELDAELEAELEDDFSDLEPDPEDDIEMTHVFNGARSAEIPALADPPEMQLRALENKAAALGTPQAVPLYMRAAELIESKIGDPRRAIAAYRRVYEIDDSNVAALQALARLADQLGDWEASSAYLARLAGLAIDPPTAARIHVAVGDLLSKDERDVKGARLQYERAAALDPTNSSAWSALAREAEHDGDDERRLRILQQRADTLDDRKTRGQLYAEIGKGWAELGQPELASDAYARAVTDDPAHDQAAGTLLADLAAKAQWRLALPLVDLLLPLAKKRGDAARVLQLVRLGGRAARALGNKERAVEAALLSYEARPQNGQVREELLEAVYMAKDDAAIVAKARPALVQIQNATDLPLTALLVLAELRGVMREWRPMAELLGRALEYDQIPARRAQVLLARARVLENELGDIQGALEAYERALIITPADLEAIVAIDRVCAAKSDRRTPERIFRRALENMPEVEREARHELMQRLGKMYKDEGQGAAAMDMFRAASRLDPSNETHREAIQDLHSESDQLDAQIERALHKVAREPLQGRGYGELYTLFLRQNAYDKAWCALDVLTVLGRLDDEERRFYDDYPPLALKDVPGQLTATAWRSHLIPTDLDAQITAILYPLTQAYLRAQVSHLEPANQRAALGQAFTKDTSRMAGEVVTTLRNAAEVLALPRPAAFVKRGVDEAVTVAPAPGNGLFICPEALEAVPFGELPFVIAQKLAEARPDLLARTLFPSTTALKNALGAAIAISRSAPFPQARNLINLGAHMNKDEMEQLRQAVGTNARDAARLDVARWAQKVDDATARSGLLLCGRVALARRALEKVPRDRDDAAGPGALSLQIGNLYQFAVSDTYGDLRGALGVGVAV